MDLKKENLRTIIKETQGMHNYMSFKGEKNWALVEYMWYVADEKLKSEENINTVQLKLAYQVLDYYKIKMGYRAVSRNIKRLR